MEFSVNLDSALSPNHYIEIEPAPNFSRLSLYPQRILLFCEDEKLKGTFAKLNSLEEIQKSYGETSQVFQMAKACLAANEGADLSVLFFLKESLSKELTCLPDLAFSQLVYPYDDKDSLKTILAILEARWACNQQLDGHLFVATSSAENAKTLAQTLNSKHLSLMATNDSPTPSWLWAAVLGATNAKESSTPAKPYTNFILPGLKPPTKSFSLKERDDLLLNGVSTFRQIRDEVILDRLVTTQTKTISGASDTSFRDLNTKQILSYLRFDLREALLMNFSRCALARDEFPYGESVVTPQTLKAFLLVKFRKWQEVNLVQDPGDQFAKKLSVIIDPRDETSLQINLPICVMGQLYVTKTKIYFSK